MSTKYTYYTTKEYENNIRVPSLITIFSESIRTQSEDLIFIHHDFSMYDTKTNTKRGGTK